MKKILLMLFLICNITGIAFAYGEPDRCTVIYPNNEHFVSGNYMIGEAYSSGGSYVQVVVTTTTPVGNRRQYIELLTGGTPMVVTYISGKVQNRLIMECH